MKSYWLKLLLLTTFAFWASGLAKYSHEAIEHHGRDASVDDDDDDDGSESLTSANTPELHGSAQVSNQTNTQTFTQPSTHAPDKKKGPCPVCQMLAAMVLDRTVPLTSPDCGNQLVCTLILLDLVAPDLLSCLASSARDPPANAFAL
jgi:hypothetical protein